MKAAIISLGSISSRWLLDALKKRFEQVDHIDIQELEVSLGEKKAQVLYQEKPLPKYDCIYAKGSARYSNLLRAITTLLQKDTYMPLRPLSFTVGHDKLLTHLKLQEANIPQPTTYIASTADAAKKVVRKIPFPVIMKMPSGTHGKGVMLAESPESASSMIDALKLLRQPFLLQEFIETDGVDYRVFVIGEQVIASMKRTAGKGEKRSNLHAGGKGEKITINDKTRKAAIAAAQAAGCDICAVDILPDMSGPLVIEINLSPGLQGITKATKVNVAEKIAEYLYKRAKAFREKGKDAIFKELEVEQEIEGPLDFRGNKILLPEVVSMASKIKEDDEVSLKAKKGQIIIKKIGKIEKTE